MLRRKSVSEDELRTEVLLKKDLAEKIHKYSFDKKMSKREIVAKSIELFLRAEGYIEGNMKKN